jgi:hypothetical protein
MKITKIAICVCVLFATLTVKLYAQAELVPLSHSINSTFGRAAYFGGNNRMHPSLQGYFVNDLHDSLSKDSLLLRNFPENKPWMEKNWVLRKLFTQHLVEVNDTDYTFYLDFLPDMQVGYQKDNNLYLNTRGVEIGGRIGRKFSFTSYLFENQGKFSKYYTDFSRNQRVIPGQGRARPMSNGGFDYGYSGGTLSYTPSKYVNFQLGYDKNFIGDGYRSLLLSDNSFNYPFFKVTATLGRVRYMAMWAQFIDQSEHFDLEEKDMDTSYPKKYGLFHYLSWNATERLSIGLFENVMWQPRGFEFSYINPIIFARSVEFANGSPDKALVGANASYKIADRYVAYGQAMINEFRFKDVFSNKGHWANKHGMQLGIKGFDAFKVDHLYLQAEMNRVRPYSYSAIEHFENYGHYNQPLAHPYGANFEEYIGIAQYRYQRFDIRLQVSHARYGLDIDGLNYGKDIYKNYNTRVAEEGIYIGNGLETKLLYSDVKAAYILNPKNNLRIELGYTFRKETNSQFRNQEQFITIGLRSSFRNLYTDF